MNHLNLFLVNKFRIVFRILPFLGLKGFIGFNILWSTLIDLEVVNLSHMPNIVIRG